MTKQQPLILCIILWINLGFILTNPVEDVDDAELIKELEQLLKGQSNTPTGPEEEDLYEEPVPDTSSNGLGNVNPVPDFEQEASNPGNVKEDLKDVCLCKKYFECNVAGNSNEIVDGPSPLPVNGMPPGGMEFDIRLGDTVGSQCSHYFDICCDSIRDNVTEIRDPEYRHTACGKRNLDGVGFRITGALNQEAQFGEFPWMTAIVSPERQEGKAPVNVFVCGGSLIHPRVVLTAAHCVYKRKVQDLTVRLGEWDTQTADEVYKHKDHSVAKIIVHEEFYAGALYNDIALLILSEDTKLAPHIDTVCLPPTNLDFDGQRCFASGWGRDSYGKEGNYQVILKKLDLPVVPNDSCEKSMRNTRLGKYFRLHESFVCAGGEKGRDTCRGDGGSPLVCKVPGTEAYVQYGIVAWGIGCGEEGVPGVYVNVPKFVPWITKKMSEAMLETRYFKLSKSDSIFNSRLSLFRR